MGVFVRGYAHSTSSVFPCGLSRNAMQIILQTEYIKQDFRTLDAVSLPCYKTSNYTIFMRGRKLRVGPGACRREGVGGANPHTYRVSNYRLPEHAGAPDMARGSSTQLRRIPARGVAKHGGTTKLKLSSVAFGGRELL